MHSFGFSLGLAAWRGQCNDYDPMLFPTGILSAPRNGDLSLPGHAFSRKAIHRRQGIHPSSVQLGRRSPTLGPHLSPNMPAGDWGAHPQSTEHWAEHQCVCVCQAPSQHDVLHSARAIAICHEEYLHTRVRGQFCGRAQHQGAVSQGLQQPQLKPLKLLRGFSGLKLCNNPDPRRRGFQGVS